MDRVHVAVIDVTTLEQHQEAVILQKHTELLQVVVIQYVQPVYTDV